MEDKDNIIGVCGSCKKEHNKIVKRIMKETGIKIEAGDIVKVAFTQGKEVEHMWVNVTEVLLGGEIRGILDNIPVLVDNVKYGQIVVKKVNSITGLIRDSEGLEINPVKE